MKIFKYKYYGLTPFSFEEKRTRFDFKPYSTAAYGKITAQHRIINDRNKKFSCLYKKISQSCREISSFYKKFSYSHKEISCLHRKISYAYRKNSCLHKRISYVYKKISYPHKKISYAYRKISCLHKKISYVYKKISCSYRKISYPVRKFTYRDKKIIVSQWKWYGPHLFLPGNFVSCIPVIETAVTLTEQNIAQFQAYSQIYHNIMPTKDRRI
jgi:hypothetical protein